MERFILFLKWVLMWTCDVIPGISGGTIAFITGIYGDLIDSLNAFNLKNFKLFFKGKFKAFWKAINWNFLVTLFAGIFVAIFSFVKIISYLLSHYPVFVWAFFFGLILASVLILRKTIKKFKKIQILFLLIGIVLWYYITSLPTFNLWTGNWTMFGAGAIAIVAMILPGISGSYILLVLGQYQQVLENAVNVASGNWAYLLPLMIFMWWAVIGLLWFSKFLYRIKSRRHDQMVVVLLWFIIWSLNKIRPWKVAIETYVDSHWEIQPLVEKAIIPARSNEVLFWILFWLLGFAIVIFVDKLAKKSE